MLDSIDSLRQIIFNCLFEYLTVVFFAFDISERIYSGILLRFVSNLCSNKELRSKSKLTLTMVSCVDRSHGVYHRWVEVFNLVG